jgi:AraC-like DNA-binding protein/quercetin dioxygenase-like cupin family protein
VSRFSQPRIGQPDGFFVVTFPMSASTLFDWHVHDDHQLAWASTGTLTVLTEGATWVLPPTRALWIPAGLSHETGAAGRATMRSVYMPPDLSPVSWREPTVVAASPLLAELITYLGRELPATQRCHAEALLSDLLTPISVTAFNVPFPEDQVAGPVARALRDNPADQRTLAEWGRTVGSSERTLARAWAAGTGLPFGRWRTLLRMQAALPLLADGDLVSRVAPRVGYETPSAFVAAFRRETGVTPAAYFERLRSQGTKRG